MTAGPGANDLVVRPALEAALDIAEAGLKEQPPLQPPRGLRAVLGFHKRPSAALSAVRRVLDRDDQFRAVVLERVDMAALSPGAEAFLRRDEGWLEVIDRAARQIDDAAADDRAREAERAAVEEVAELRARVAALEALNAADTAELTRLAEIEFRHDEVADRIARLETVNERLTGERQRAVRELADERRRLADRTAEVRELRAALECPRQAASEFNGPSSGSAVPNGDEAAAALSAKHDGELDRALARAEAAEASVVATGREVERFAQGLSELSKRLGSGAPPATEHTAGSGGDEAAGEGNSLDNNAPGAQAPSSQTLSASSPRAGAGVQRRRPVRVGRGLSEGTAAATRALLETPGLVLWVDGYNVTMALWADLELPAQRRALIDSLGRLATALGTHIRVVFDGDTGGAPAVRAPLRVRVLFTEAGVEADDDIIEAVERMEAAIPVAVMSADRRVRDGCAAHGANLLSAEDLRALLAGAGGRS